MSALLLGSSNALAAVTITFEESGSDVVGTATGSINTTGFTQVSESLSNRIYPGAPYVVLGLGASIATTSGGLYVPSTSVTSSSSSWGTNIPTSPTSATGDRFGVYFGSYSRISIPTGYASGASITSSSTFANKTLVTMGLNPGTHTYEWGSGASADSVTVIVNAPPPPTVTSVSPASGPITGGTLITITGTGLSGATGITVRGQSCAIPTSVSATAATCITRGGVSGAASVVVTNRYGSNAANTLFTYEEPVTTAIPTLSEWAMIFLASLMGLFAFARIRRQS